MRVIVVGTGDKAHGLANMYESNAKRGSVDLVFTEPIPTKSYAPFNQYVSVEPYPEALERADIVILAIPAYALWRTFLFATLASSRTITSRSWT